MFFIFWIFRRTAKRRKRKPVTEKRPNLLFLWLRMYPRGFSFLKASGKRGEEGCSRTFPPLFIRLLASGSSSRQKQISINLILKNIKKKKVQPVVTTEISLGVTHRGNVYTHNRWDIKIGLDWSSESADGNQITIPKMEFSFLLRLKFRLSLFLLSLTPESYFWRSSFLIAASFRVVVGGG